MSKNMIVIDRRELLNGNSFILGTSGSGKSFIAKNEVMSAVLNQDCDVIIVDLEGEYTSLVKAFGWEVIDISATSKNHINAIGINKNYGDGSDPIVLKSELLLSLCSQLVGEKRWGQSRNLLSTDVLPTSINHISLWYCRDGGANFKRLHR